MKNHNYLIELIFFLHDGYSRVYPMRLPKNAYFVYRTTTCHNMHLYERIGRRRLSHRSFSCCAKPPVIANPSLLWHKHGLT
ncbi:hypothetical protein Prudu_008562 [Prunus dulcis]|uniref:Uncharacterized protein n=1 Tax=Prunus dulcis TaxID=3755 RepID=A0A4Y1R4T7_PRUDU|nr:hypothetical protein Prudu_008562 [Prunus dulcis]